MDFSTCTHPVLPARFVEDAVFFIQCAFLAFFFLTKHTFFSKLKACFSYTENIKGKLKNFPNSSGDGSSFSFSLEKMACVGKGCGIKELSNICIERCMSFIFIKQLLDNELKEELIRDTTESVESLGLPHFFRNL